MLLAILILSFSILFSLFSNEEALRRIQAHLIIHDFQSAKEEASQLITKNPHSEQAHEAYIRSLAACGDEKEMIAAWYNYLKLFPEKKENRVLIEEMCWGVLRKASDSPSIFIRLMSCLGAFYSQDSRGIEMLRQRLNDSNAAIRGAAVLLSSQLKDTKLINEIKRLYKQETVLEVRKGVIDSIGHMHIKEMAGDLESLIASDETLTEEKVAAIKSLVLLLDEQQMKREAIVKMANSNRYGFRLLACKVIAHFRFERDVDILLKMCSDPQADVKAAALQALGLIRPKNLSIELPKKMLDDPDLKTGITAAWLLTLYSIQDGVEAFNKFLQYPKQETRLLAAAALAHTGKYGSHFIQQNVQTYSDPYVQLNLALGLIGQRLQLTEAAFILEKIVLLQNDKLIWHEEGIFRFITPRTAVKTESSDIEMEDQLVRLEVLNILAMIDARKAQENIRKFLLERAWGVTGAAAGVLLMEGDDAAIDSVQQLLNDQNARVRIQAALILSLWSRDEKPIQVLEEGYEKADQEMKAKILEGIGRIGSMQSVPFLINVLKEPSQFLRIIAATVLIQCLNH